MTRSIPIHYLNEDTAFDAEVVHLTYMCERWNKLNDFDAHIDDCYTIILVSKGYGTTDIDFRTVSLSENQLGIIAPGQVHSNIRVKECEAWMLRISPDMMDNDYRHLIDEFSIAGEVIELKQDTMMILCEALGLLSKLIESMADTKPLNCVVFNMLNVILGIITPKLINRQPKSHLRAAEITIRFKRMLPQFVRQQKKTSFYANELCISKVYLNEVVKKCTGMTPTEWINATIVLEAKRLLRSTSSTVKEIAHELGFEDHAYFSRLFRKSTAMTPLDFRTKILK